MEQGPKLTRYTLKKTKAIHHGNVDMDSEPQTFHQLVKCETI